MTTTGHPLAAGRDSRRRNVGLALALLVLVAGAAVLVVAVTGIGERIPVGVRVDGVDIGGISPADAERRLGRHVRERVSRPVLVVGQRLSIQTSGAQLGARAGVGEAIADAEADRLGLFRRWLGLGAERQLRLDYELGPARVAALATRLGPAVPAADAAIMVDASGVRVRPARAGRVVDVTSLGARLKSLPPVLHVPTIATPPRVTTAAAHTAAQRVRRLVDTPRTIVLGTSSYTLDPSTLRALVVGGGISQVATMLYNGAFFAGLELVEHQPHSLYIDRYPLGREATISWGGPELIVRNDWPAAVLIKLEATETSITTRFFSSRLGRRVETETSVPYGHGGGSFTVEYTRRVYRGTRLAREELHRVRYGTAPAHAATGGR